MTRTPPQARRIEYIDLDTLTSATRNPKRHQLTAIRASIGRFGFVTPAVIDERTNRLVIGHGRTQALRAMRDDGETPPAGVRLHEDAWLVPVLYGWASRSDAEAEAYLVADNRHTELGGWDHDLLSELLSDLNDVDPDLLAVTGYDGDDLADMVRSSTPPDLDALAAELGEPEESDAWPTIRIRVPQHIASAWNAHLAVYERDEVRAFAALLDVPAEADAPADELVDEPA